MFDVFGEDQFLPNSWIMDLIGKFVCGSTATNPLCDSVLFLIAGPESNQLNNVSVYRHSANKIYAEDGFDSQPRLKFLKIYI